MKDATLRLEDGRIIEINPTQMELLNLNEKTITMEDGTTHHLAGELEDIVDEFLSALKG